MFLALPNWSNPEMIQHQPFRDDLKPSGYGFISGLRHFVCKLTRRYFGLLIAFVTFLSVFILFGPELSKSFISRPSLIAGNQAAMKGDQLPLLYQSQQVLDMRFQYAKQVDSNEQQFKVIYSDKGSDQGFGSFFNMMLMAMHYSHLDGVKRLFQLNTDTFGYGRLSDFFFPMEYLNGQFSVSNEFNNTRYLAANNGKSMFTSSLDGADFEHLDVDYGFLYIANTKKTIMFAKEKNQPRLPVLGMRHLTGHFYNKVYLEMNGNFDKAYTKQELLKQRRVLAQAFWEPLPHVRREIDHVLSQVSGPFIAIHCRRGDKVNSESGNLKADVYVKKVEELLKYRYDTKTILLISDDVKYLSEIKSGLEKSSLFDKSLKILKINDLFSNNAGTKELIGNGWQQSSLGKANPTDSQTHTLRLIVSLTVMARADHVICTHSSNLCRLVQQLRTQPERSLISLDGDWHQF